MSISDYQKTVVLLSEASRLHKRATNNLEKAQIAYGGKPYSSEAYFDLVIASNEHSKARFYLDIILNESQELKDKVIADIREHTGITSQTTPDSLSNRTFTELVDALVIIIMNNIQPTNLARLINLLIEGELASLTELVDDTTVVFRTIMQDSLNDSTFGIGLTLSQLWNNPPNYPYDREGVAQYAIDRSRINFENLATDNPPGFPFGSGNQLSGDIIKGVGGNFWYQTGILDHITPTAGQVGKTGSSIFISECLHVGGNLPMVEKTIEIEGEDEDCVVEPIVLSNIRNAGWRVCCQSGAQDITNVATFTWKDHGSIANYYGEINSVFSFDTLNAHMNFSQGTYQTSEEEFQSIIYQLFSESPLNLLETGDYVVVGPNTEFHGFLIVGWGPATDKDNGLNAKLNTEPNTESNAVFTIERQYNGKEVPYVVDFAYGYKNDGTTDATGWLQDVRPRPFYFSAMEIPSLSYTDNPAYYGFSTMSEYIDRMRGGYTPFLTSEGPRPDWVFVRMADYVVEPNIYQGC